MPLGAWWPSGHVSAADEPAFHPRKPHSDHNLLSAHEVSLRAQATTDQQLRLLQRDPAFVRWRRGRLLHKLAHTWLPRLFVGLSLLLLVSAAGLTLVSAEQLSCTAQRSCERAASTPCVLQTQFWVAHHPHQQQPALAADSHAALPAERAWSFSPAAEEQALPEHEAWTQPEEPSADLEDFFEPEYVHGQLRGA